MKDEKAINIGCITVIVIFIFLMVCINKCDSFLGCKKRPTYEEEKSTYINSLSTEEKQRYYDCIERNREQVKMLELSRRGAMFTDRIINDSVERKLYRLCK